MITLQVVASRFSREDYWSHTELVQAIVEDGGEGIIMRKARSLYEQGRSTSLFKLKASYFLIYFNYNFFNLLNALGFTR